MGDIFIWLTSFFILIALIALIVFQLMCLADLEFDYINPYDSSSRINKVVLPEFIIQGLLCVFYLLTGHWVMSLLCAPYLYYNVRHYFIFSLHCNPMSCQVKPIWLTGLFNSLILFDNVNYELWNFCS
ncbi:protein cornichon homolog 4-like isoform X2 [Hibiscus syriacus]|uniref:protein cornichon homolog 4-like isoform X2 n=1 Tax=Hibiscus syriacus TaxID=106335 RepID=UPI00192216BB|nr:protein cornichon homolog 4-like isoform X2 [Hibiscus syriacus]